MFDFLLTLAGGFLATLAMPLGLYLLPVFRLLSPNDQVRAYGSFYTGSEANAFWPGLIFGVVMGFVWAFVYAALWSLFGGKTFGFYILLGLVSGAFFGENLSLTSVLVFVDNHPVQRFRDEGWRIALGTVLMHIVHGFVFAVVAGAYELDYGFIPKVVLFP